MKRYAENLSEQLSNADYAELNKELRESSGQDRLWIIEQLFQVRKHWVDYLYSPSQPILSDTWLLGGEGMPETKTLICDECARTLISVMDLQFEDSVSPLQTQLEPDNTVTLTRYDNFTGPLADEPGKCLCGNWLWLRTNHAMVLELIEAGDMTSAIGTAYINRNLSYGFDSRSPYKAPRHLAAVRENN